MGVFPGQIMNGTELQPNWKAYETQTFMTIVANYSDTDLITLITGGFIGRFEMRAPVDLQAKSRTPVLITPSVSPVYNNNPGFTAMTYTNETGTWSDLKAWFYQL